jgi:hypothetical protein
MGYSAYAMRAGHGAAAKKAKSKRGTLLPLAAAFGERADPYDKFEKLTTRTVASEAPEVRAIAELVERALGDLDLDR